MSASAADPLPYERVDLRPGYCTCGCLGRTDKRFVRGHASRLKGFLRRAQQQGAAVPLKIGPGPVVYTTVEAAVTYLDGPDAEWSGWLRGEHR